jgi:histidine ammonia-lyase
MNAIRAVVPFYKEDRYFAPDIEAAKRLVVSGAFNARAADLLPSGGESALSILCHDRTL